MIVDASAIVALVLREPGWERLVDAIDRAESVAIGAPTMTEASIVLAAKGVPPTVLPALLAEVEIEVVPYTRDHAHVAATAYRRFGRGRHPAALNFGDCMSYATAALARAPMLFVGDDVGRTDLTPALPR